MTKQILFLCMTLFIASGDGYAVGSDPWSNTTDVELSSTWVGETDQAVLNVVSDQDVVLEYANQPGAPTFEEDTMKLALPSNVVPDSISFNIEPLQYSPSALRVCFESASGRRWDISLPSPDVGFVNAYEVLFDYHDKWFSSDGVDDAVSFGEDLRSITWVGIYVRRHSSVLLQSYSFESLQIDGIRFSSEDADMDKMPDSWEVANGLDSSDFSDAALDTDADGASNYDEYIMGSNPNDASSRLRMSIAQPTSTAGSIRVTWDSVSGRQYEIWRTTNILGDFVRIADSIEATPPKNTFDDTEDLDAKSKFYRIHVLDPQ